MPSLPGEAIDSWLEALAARTHTAWADLITAVGLKPSGGTCTSQWIVQLRPGESTAIATASGLDADTIDAMTLSHYADRGVRIDTATRTVNRAFPWGRSSGSRYCPQCLAATGGRWQLSWRLGWAFACTEHHCLLADGCPSCGGVQRLRPHISDAIPAPAHCANPAPGATGRAPARCAADLTATPVAQFTDDHPVLVAQHIVYDVIETATAQFGVYHRDPKPGAGVLADIRAVAGRVLAYASHDELANILPADLVTAYRAGAEERSGPARAQNKPGLATPAYAATAAVGVAAALTSLSKPDIAAAAAAMRWLVSGARDRGLSVSTANIGWGRRTTSTLTAAQIAALAPLLKPSEQLRYRTASEKPSRPIAGSARVDRLAQRTPTMFWPAWSLRMTIPTCHQRHLRPALSAAMMLVGTRLTLHEAGKRIAAPMTGQGLSRVLQLLEQNEWSDVSAVLTLLADYLADTETPIDYQRRRRLDFSTLLPNSAWARVCRDTATPGRRSARARVARCYLFERLSALPASAAPFACDDNEFRTKTADFPEHLTPELAAALDRHGQDFLTTNGIGDEPLTWHPPTAMLGDLHLPGHDPAAVDIGELHRLIRVEDYSLGAAAEHLGTTLETVRHLLTTHPAPAREPVTHDQGRVRGTGYRTAKSALTPDRLQDLYETDGRGLRDIAASIGVDRKTVAQLAHDYGIPLRVPGRQTRHHVDRDWLYDQYVNKRRAFPDLARECGMSTANMERWAKTHNIPKRSRGGPSHSANLAAAAEAQAAPDILRPALAGIGGWERLQRFAAASPYPTMTIAAKELGVHQFTLVNQINRLERELDQKLLVRAERGRPMELTPFGSRVVGAVNARSKAAPAEMTAPTPVISHHLR
ncbi:TniQ family protein [Candidatus Mycobacterium methanotrophicum]|uniref:TniQ family protein n=1 Tax=Candidatus Mycobacterium methanotrophicum TaxID=2943498 RepID=A0ABY4QM26_9MYCO|nr:TniQ family protein [Candidatus Mycobacterium methanotrophicum]UQX10996.1 TniQ family protein [Candidatus Mycobacterium methanotrophicum]